MTLYGLPVFIYSVDDDGEYDAPWRAWYQNPPASYAGDDDPNKDSEVWRNSAKPPSFSAFANTQAAEVLRSVLWSTMSPSHRDFTPTSNVPVRSVILEVTATADTVLYDRLREFTAANAGVTEIETLWNQTRRRIDLFSTAELARWIGHLIAIDDSARAKLGLADGNQADQDDNRQLWIQILRRIRNRFVHRSTYFLEQDFTDMRECINHPNRAALLRAKVFEEFVKYVANKISDLSQLRVT